MKLYKPREGGTPLYKPQRAGFLGLFGLKTGTDFAYFGLERVWFSKELRANVFIISIPHE